MSNKTKNNTLISWFFTSLSLFSGASTSAHCPPKNPEQPTNTVPVRYNDVCNGSLAWLSSTTETRDAQNSAATISPDKKYYGINQLSGYNVSRLIKFINTNDKYQKLRGHLSCSSKYVKDKNGKTILAYDVDATKWKKLAQTQNALFTSAQEDFLCEVYLPECFQKLQKSLIKEAEKSQRSPINISNLNPVVLSLFARLYIKGPNSKIPFNAIKSKSIVEINSDKFIKDFCGRNEYLKKKALSAFNKTGLIWNEYQITKACSLAQTEYTKYQNLAIDAKNQSRINNNKSENKKIATPILQAIRNGRQKG